MDNVALREKKFNRWITLISISVPIFVAVLFRVRIPNVERLGFLPPIYATINALTAVLLFVAVLAIMNGKRKLHQNLMTTCIGLSVLFLLMYIAYHMTSDSTSYGGTYAIMRYFYYFILATHIILSIAIIPLVLKTYSFAYLGKFESHRKWAQFTFPLWMYVAITGVVVYLMISPYYVN